MTITNPDSLTALRDLGCLNENTTVNRDALARQLAQRLEQGHIAASMDDVATAETTIGGLATAVLGHADPDFIEYVKLLSSTKAVGHVQQALANGYVLCGRRIPVEIDIDGQITHVSVATRFLSSDPDVLRRYVLDGQVHRFERLANATVAMGELVAARQPAMAPDLAEFLAKLTDTWQRALGTGETS